MPTHGRLDLRSGGTAASFARESAQPRASATRPRRTFLLHSDPCSSNESHVRVLQSEAHDAKDDSDAVLAGEDIPARLHLAGESFIWRVRLHLAAPPTRIVAPLLTIFAGLDPARLRIGDSVEFMSPHKSVTCPPSLPSTIPLGSLKNTSSPWQHETSAAISLTIWRVAL